MLLAAQRDEVLACCRELAATGLVRGTSGNVSVRDPDTGAIAISPTGVRYSSMRAADVPVLDEHGQRLDGELAPTSELALHLAVYQARAEVGAIVHTHSMFATTFAVLGEPIPMVHYLLLRAGRQSPRVAPYARYGTEELATACVQALGQDGAVLLANHGVVAVGADLVQAMAIADAVEYTAELAWRARQLGQPNVLTGAQCQAAAEALDRYGLQPSAERAEPPNGE